MHLKNIIWRLSISWFLQTCVLESRNLSPHHIRYPESHINSLPKSHNNINNKNSNSYKQPKTPDLLVPPGAVIASWPNRYPRLTSNIIKYTFNESWEMSAGQLVYNFETNCRQLCDNFWATWRQQRQLWDNFMTTFDNFGAPLRHQWDNFRSTLRQVLDYLMTTSWLLAERISALWTAYGNFIMSTRRLWLRLIQKNV